MTFDATRADDAAWVNVPTSLAPEALGAFCADLERLFRLNPYLEFHQWQPLGQDRYRTELTNHSNARRVVLEMHVERQSVLAFRVDYASGVKKSTSFQIRQQPGGSSLVITDDYSERPEGSAAGREAEVDRSLHAWGVALHDFLAAERRWGWLPLWHIAVRRLWLPMTPSGRRITRLLLLIAAAELLLIVVAVMGSGYVIQMQSLS
jgi:hypothetical protein